MLTTYKATVTSVRDGDTFFAPGVGWVRLAEVNTPESWEFGYTVAKQRLADWILWREVQIIEVARDDYGRVVADVYVGGRHVNEVMRGYGYRP